MKGYDYMELIKNLGLFSIGSISIAGAIVFITKALITKSFDGFFEAYKLTLNKEIESFKMNLQKQSYEHNVTFNKLHLERAEIIKNLYAKLVDMQDELSLYIKSMIINNSTYEIPEDLRISVGDFMTYTNHNRIYFDDDICFNVKEIEALIMFILSFFEKDIEGEEPEGLKIFVKSLVDEEIPKFKTVLEKQFRSILGVTINVV